MTHVNTTSDPEDSTGANESAEDGASLEDADDPTLTSLLEYLKQSRGFDFTGYKRPSLARRIRKRMGTVHVETFADYESYLEANPAEFAQLFNTVLINVTAFFRDGRPWEILANEVIPALLSRKAAGTPIRVWSAGCATGEEAYTLAMVLAESMGAEQFRDRVKIYATDVDDDALVRARAASYTARDVDDVPEDLRRKYFEVIADRYIFRKHLRRAIVFGRNDLVQDAPISKIDVLVSRNTLMYFDSPTQARILNRFHFALNDGGYLLLGRAESLLTYTSTFTPVDLKNRIFMKAPRDPGNEHGSHAPATSSSASQATEPTPHARLRSRAFDAAPVAQIVIDRQGILVAANERARGMFGVTAADIGRPLQDLEVSYRPTELRSLVDQAYAERHSIIRNDVPWVGITGDSRWLSLQVIPILERGMIASGATLNFSDVTGTRRLQEELEATNHELETAFEELQSTNEELETTNEELQSTVEELETTNEELQSTNEELETMNEELQSTNEELQAVNEEAKRRSDAVDDANDFLESIFASLRAGVTVVDPSMKVLVWNSRAEDLWGLRREEVVGSNFLNLDIGLPVADLRTAIKSVLTGSEAVEEETVRAITRRGRTIECGITVLPLMSSIGDEPAVRGALVLMDGRDSDS